MRRALCIAMLGLAGHAVALSVTDDTGHVVSVPKAAQRIISLAPHATELLFAAGAGAQLVGVSDYSDYPEAAKKIANVGNVFALDLERILALRPDLVVIWGTGNGRTLAQKLRDQHLNVFESEPRNFDMVASSIERLGTLAGTAATGTAAAAQFRARLANLRKTYSDGSAPVTVFYQIARKPLMTLNDSHMVADAIRLCGGKNIFGTSKEIAPSVSTEAVIAADPDTIITASDDGDALADWQRFPQLKAVSRHHLYSVKSDWLNRAGPRIADGTEALCRQIAHAKK